MPVFNDKHLSWKWEWAKEMVDTSRELNFPFLAGSSLPVTWRMPSIDLPYGAEVEEVMCVAIGGVDSYDFHALEVIQCMAERRHGGETGVVALQALRGDAVWKAMEAGSWADGGWDPQLFEACLCRSQTLAQPPTLSHRYPTPQQMREWVKEPVAYRFEYADGSKATMLLMNGLVGDFTFAARLKGQAEPLSTLFYLPPNPNVVYSAALMSKAEEMFLTGKAPYPVERTLLTTGLVEAGMQSLANEQQRIETPHLDVRYRSRRRNRTSGRPEIQNKGFNQTSHGVIRYSMTDAIQISTTTGDRATAERIATERSNDGSLPACRSAAPSPALIAGKKRLKPPKSGSARLNRSPRIIQKSNKSSVGSIRTTFPKSLPLPSPPAATPTSTGSGANHRINDRKPTRPDSASDPCPLLITVCLRLCIRSRASRRSLHHPARYTPTSPSLGPRSLAASTGSLARRPSAIPSGCPPLHSPIANHWQWWRFQNSFHPLVTER